MSDITLEYARGRVQQTENDISLLLGKLAEDIDMSINSVELHHEHILGVSKQYFVKLEIKLEY